MIVVSSHALPSPRRRRALCSGSARSLLAGILVAAACGLGAPVAAETLEEALAATYTSNPTLQSARAELRATDELVPQALSGWRPTAAINGELGEEWEDSNISGDETRTPRSANLNITQPIYRGGRTVASTNQAESLVLAQREFLLGIEQDVLLQGVTA